MILFIDPPPVLDHGHAVIEHLVLIAQPPPLIRATVPPARPGHIAEREELDAAIAKGTIEALELFIRRHPRSRYRDEAEQRLRAIGGKPTPL